MEAVSTNSKDIATRFITAYRKAEKILADTRRAELASVDTIKSLQSLLPAFDACVKSSELLPYSGLIEQQRLFMLSRKS
jgi:hypothetical protein